jgi:hypothetical protein
MLAVAIMHGLVGLMTLIGVWAGLPTRWLWVDLPATLLGLANVASAIALVAGLAWARRRARTVTQLGLGLGCVTVTLLAWSASHLAGQYGPVGAGGALLLSAIAALIVPYFVGLPLLQAWLLRSRD